MTEPQFIPCPHCSGSGNVENPRHTAQVMRGHRRAAGATLKQIAAGMGISISYLSDLEHARPGKHWNPDLMARFWLAVKGLAK